MDFTYRIRPALAADLESIFSLDRAIKTVPHWTVKDYLAALSPPDHKAELSGTGRCLFVAAEASQVIGFVAGKVTVAELEVSAELETIAVAESARRRGIGKALCKAVIEWSDSQRASEIELEVRSRSAGPITLYSGLGFTPIGLRKNYYREPLDDAILMRLTLASGPPSRSTPDRDL